MRANNVGKLPGGDGGSSNDHWFIIEPNRMKI